MPTPAHTNFDSTKPDGHTAGTTGTTFETDIVNNERALRDMIIAGQVPGFIQSRTNGTGTASQPQFITWLNASLSIGFRWNITWTGFQPTTVTEEWSNDNGATWTAVTAQVNTFDGSNNITASTVAGGWVTVLYELWTKCLKVVSDFATHQAATGTAVHGLGTIATQNANAIAATGGTIDGTDVGNTVRAKGSFTRVAEALNTYTPALNAGVTVDWAAGGGSKITHNGTNAITFANIPTGAAGHVIDIDAFNNATWPAATDWGSGGIPSIAGRALVSLITDDVGTKVMATVPWHL